MKIPRYFQSDRHNGKWKKIILFSHVNYIEILSFEYVFFVILFFILFLLMFDYVWLFKIILFFQNILRHTLISKSDLAPYNDYANNITCNLNDCGTNRFFSHPIDFDHQEFQKNGCRITNNKEILSLSQKPIIKYSEDFINSEIFLHNKYKDNNASNLDIGVGFNVSNSNNPEAKGKFVSGYYISNLISHDPSSLDSSSNCEQNYIPPRGTIQSENLSNNKISDNSPSFSNSQHSSKMIISIVDHDSKNKISHMKLPIGDGYQNTSFSNERYLNHNDNGLENCTQSLIDVNIKCGFIGVLVALIGYCYLRYKNKFDLISWSPSMRILHLTCLAYFLFISFLSCIEPESGRKSCSFIISNFDRIADQKAPLYGFILQILSADNGQVNNLVDYSEKYEGIKLEMKRSYTQNAVKSSQPIPTKDCTITYKSIMKQVKSPWFVAHIVGWFGKMFILRNWVLCFMYSALFELFELTFQPLIPEFNECWWDSIFIDFFLTNILGMALGYYLLGLSNVCRYYDWINGSPSLDASDYKIKHSRNHDINNEKFLNDTLCKGHITKKCKFNFFRSPKNLFQVVYLLIICNLCELNVFFLKHALNFPCTHPINVFRCIIIALLAYHAATERYEYMNNQRSNVGLNESLLVFTVLGELAIFCKYEFGVIKLERFLPFDIIFTWMLSIILFGIWCAFYFIFGCKCSVTSSISPNCRGFPKPTVLNQSDEQLTAFKKGLDHIKSTCENSNSAINKFDNDPYNSSRDRHFDCKDKINQISKIEVSDAYRDLKYPWIMLYRKYIFSHLDKVATYIMLIPPIFTLIPLIYLTKNYH